LNYFPYFRGKQFELICLRENAALIANSGFTPIVEPVKEDLLGLQRALTRLDSDNAKYLVVANPSVGSHSKESIPAFTSKIAEVVDSHVNGGWLFRVDDGFDLDSLRQWLHAFPETCVLHSGALPVTDVRQVLNEFPTNRTHIFGSKCSIRYRAEVGAPQQILLQDGFVKRKNSEYPEVEPFSDLNLTYQLQGAQGFGDFLIVGDDYSESGGAAYAVAIHLTFSDGGDGGAIHVRHFISDTNFTASDPAGKFKEAVDKLARHCLGPDSKIPVTRAVQEFVKLDSSGHFPGLGYVKKLCMQHHLEVMAAL
jgi:hypothetical protein